MLVPTQITSWSKTAPIWIKTAVLLCHAPQQHHPSCTLFQIYPHTSYSSWTVDKDPRVWYKIKICSFLNDFFFYWHILNMHTNSAVTATVVLSIKSLQETVKERLLNQPHGQRSCKPFPAGTNTHKHRAQSSFCSGSQTLLFGKILMQVVRLRAS